MRQPSHNLGRIAFVTFLFSLGAYSCEGSSSAPDAETLAACDTAAHPLMGCSPDFSCILSQYESLTSTCVNCLAAGILACGLEHCPLLYEESCHADCLKEENTKLCFLENCGQDPGLPCVIQQVEGGRCDELFAECGIPYITLPTSPCDACTDQNRTCSITAGDATCGACAPGTIETGSTCEPATECPSEACTPHGSCQIVDGTARCSCEPGYAPTESFSCGPAFVTNQWIDIVPYGSEASFWQGTQPYEEIEDTESTIYNALPCHPITFTQPYAMMKYEVSVSEHWRCVAAGACTDPAPCWSGSAHDPSDPRLANHPVICISTDHAEDYCAWVGGRLPSEAEWEYAATKADSCVPHLNYPWGVGGIDGDIANYLGGGNPFAATEAPFTQSGGPTTPVGFFDGSLRTREESQWIGGPDSFQTRNNASPFGLYDMSGNVAEWTLDCWNENYEGKPHLDGAPWVEGDSDCALRVKRGDGWSDVEQALTTYFRAPRTPFANKNFLGVRCVRALHEANQ